MTGRWLFLVVVVGLASHTAQAETLGPYIHGEFRENDGKLIVCYDEASAVNAAQAVNAAFMALLPEIEAASDEQTLQLLYQTDLYPSPGWQDLLKAIRELRCDLVDEASHVSRSTVFRGPADLISYGASHSVVRSDFVSQFTQATTRGWVVTTEEVP
ncbi:MAG: hypothetical protein GDA49_07865 [Rhodospirillales bacterium]|nr:hypothetical protein [Rhodospirillales bacterium]